MAEILNKDNFVFEASRKIRGLVEENQDVLIKGTMCFDAIETLIALQLEDLLNNKQIDVQIKKDYSEKMETNPNSFTMGKLLDVIILLENEGKQGTIEYLQALTTLRTIMKGW